MKKKDSGAAVQEMQINDVMAVHELRGNYPEIAISESVDYDSLIAGDDDPMFLTLPIGKANVKSGNGRFYDEAFVQELERQTRDNKPIGIMGHLKESDRATEFPEEAVHWVGVQRQGDLLWGKGYVPKGQARDRIRRYKATGKKIATSIDAFVKGSYDAAKDAIHVVAKSLQLNQIDIAPADRAGIPALANIPIITKEMDENPKEPEMDKLQVINEMTAEDARLLPEPVRNAVLETVQEAPEVAIVGSIREALGLDDGSNPLAAIQEMKKTQEDAAKTAVTSRIQELVNDGIKVESMQSLVTELVIARNPQTKEEAEAAYTAVTEMDSVKETLKATVSTAMGGKLTTPMQPKNGKATYFNIPKDGE